MRLSTQIFGLISLVYVMVFCGTLTIAVSNTRDFLNQQLASHAQDTATSLGLSLSLHHAGADAVMMESIVDAIFDRGFYQTISVYDAAGGAILVRELTVRASGVPQWFVERLPLETPLARASIKSGWRDGGEVLVSSHPGYGYEELWDTAIETLSWYSLTLLVALTLTAWFLRIILRPLRALEAQAAGMAERKFDPVDQVPRTRELRRVVQAMNQSATKVESMLREQLALTEQVRADAFEDPVTNLQNARGFDRVLTRLVEEQEHDATGLLVLVKAGGLNEANQLGSLSAGDKHLRETAGIIRRVMRERDCALARIGGSVFALLLPGIPMRECKDLLDELVRAVRPGQDSEPDAARAHAGAAYISAGIGRDELMERASRCLMEATDAHEPWRAFDNLSPQSPAVESQRRRWRNQLQEAIRAQRLVLHYQPVVTCQRTAVLHHEALLRIHDQDGTCTPAGLFFPIAELVGMSSALDRQVTTLLLRTAQDSARSDARFAMNLSLESLADEEFRSWFTCQLAASGVASKIRVEVAEQATHHLADACGALAAALNELESALAIDHFGGWQHGIERLRDLRPEYVKIDRSLTQGLGRDALQREYTRALVASLHGMDCRAIAEHVEHQDDFAIAARLGFDGVQGHLIGAPEPLRDH